MLLVEVEQDGQSQLAADAVHLHAPPVVNRQPHLVLAEAFAPPLGVGVEDVFQSVAAAGVAGAGVDAAEGDQPVAVGLRLSRTASLVEMNVAASGDTTGITHARSTPLASIHSSSPSAVSSFVWFHVWPRCV